MSLALKRIKVYFRVGVVFVAAGAIGLVLVKNRGNTVVFWFFGLTDESRPINVLWLILCIAAATVVVRSAVVLGWRLRRDVRELRRLRSIEETAKHQEERAARLEEHERRIDDKVKRAISEDHEVGG